MSNFNIKKFLTENKLTSNSRRLDESILNNSVGVQVINTYFDNGEYFVEVEILLYLQSLSENEMDQVVSINNPFIERDLNAERDQAYIDADRGSLSSDSFEYGIGSVYAALDKNSSSELAEQVFLKIETLIQALYQIYPTSSGAPVLTRSFETYLNKTNKNILKVTISPPVRY